MKKYDGRAAGGSQTRPYQTRVTDACRVDAWRLPDSVDGFKLVFPLNCGAAWIRVASLPENWCTSDMAGDSFKYAGTLARSAEKRDERRKIPRYAVNVDSEVEEPHARAKINGRMTDLGLGGCYVDAIVTFPVNTAVHVRMTREDLHFEADAKVVFSKAGLGMGLAFTEMTSAHRRYLAEWIDELAGTEPIVEQPTRSGPGDNQEAGELSNQAALHRLIKILLRRDLINQSDFEQILQAIGKQVRAK